MAEILLVSKAVRPPWNDSSKNLVRDLATAMRRHRPHVMAREGDALGDAAIEPIYGVGRSRFSPALADQLRVMRRLVFGRREDLWHFFFAPNPRSSLASGVAARLRRRPTVHTVCSAPAEGVALERVLFADLTVVLSAHTEARLIEQGYPADRLARVPPSVPFHDLPTNDDALRARRALGLPVGPRLLVYPGDLEFGSGAQWSLEAAASLRDVHLVIAARAKTPRARTAELALRDRAARLGVACSFLGETPAIVELLGAADIVLLPSETLYAKMDYPLVVLEAMVLGRPVIVGAHTPAAELREVGAYVVDPGREPLAALLDELLARDLTHVGGQGRKQVLERYSPAAMARSYEQLYDRLL